MPTTYRGVASGWAGGARAQNLADQLTLFKPWGADYANHTTTSPRIQNAIYTSDISLSQPRFLTLRRPCVLFENMVDDW